MKSGTARLGDVTKLNPPTPRGLLASEAEVAVVPMAAVSSYGSMQVQEYKKANTVSSGLSYFADGDVLVAKITPCFENNKITEAVVDREHAFGSTEFHVLRPEKGRLDSRYLTQFLRQDSVREAGARRMTGSGGQRRVPRSFIEELEIPLPPLGEQRRIAAILDCADALRRKRREAILCLMNLSGAKFQEMFGESVGPRTRYPQVELGSVIDPARPVTYGILKPGPDIPNGQPYVRVVDIKAGTILTQQLRRTSPEIATQYKRSTLQAGDLLISIRGHVGRLAFVPETISGANITQDTARLAILGANPTFVRSALESPLGMRWMKNHTRGIAVQGINLGDLRKFPLILPPQSEQNTFAKFVLQAEQARYAAEKQLYHLDALFASLQYRAFRGEL